MTETVFKIQYINRLLVLDNRCFQNIVHVCCDHLLSNVEFRCRVLDENGKSVNEVLKLKQLRWLRYLLRMLNYRLTRRALLFGVEVNWKKASGNQIKTWNQSIRLLITEIHQ